MRRCANCQWINVDLYDEPERSNWSILLLAGLTVALLEICRWLTH